jgi:hypothetical protein
VTAWINVSIAMATVAIFSGFVRTDPAQAIGLIARDSFYSDYSSFFGNTNGLQTIDFEGLAIPDSPTSFQDLTPNPINGVTFAGPNLYLAHIGGGNRFPSSSILVQDYLTSRNACDVSGCGSTSSTALLPTGITAVGAFLSTLQNDLPPTFSTSFTISLADGSAQVISGNSGFAGFTSSSDISSIAFSIPARNFSDSQYSGNFLALDGFRFGSANAATSVPEPFTVIGTLVGGSAALRMRKKLRLAAK